MVDVDVRLHLLLNEGDDIGGRDPWRTEASCDVGGPKVCRLDISQGADIAPISRIEFGRSLRGGELGAHSAGEISVGCLPRSVCRITEHGVTQFIDHISRIAVQELRDMVDIDMPAFI